MLPKYYSFKGRYTLSHRGECPSPLLVEWACLKRPVATGSLRSLKARRIPASRYSERKPRSHRELSSGRLLYNFPLLRPMKRLPLIALGNKANRRALHSPHPDPNLAPDPIIVQRDVCDTKVSSGKPRWYDKSSYPDLRSTTCEPTD